MFDWVSSNGAPSFTTPTGWTLIGDHSGGGAGGGGTRVTMKKLSASDPGSTITGSNEDSEKKLMLVFKGGFSTITAQSFVGEFGGGGVGPATVTSSGGTTPLIIFGHYSQDGTSGNLTGSTAFDAEEQGADAGQIAGYKIVTASPANHTVDSSASNTADTLEGFYIEVEQ